MPVGPVFSSNKSGFWKSAGEVYIKIFHILLACWLPLQLYFGYYYTSSVLSWLHYNKKYRINQLLLLNLILLFVSQRKMLVTDYLLERFFGDFTKVFVAFISYETRHVAMNVCWDKRSNEKYKQTQCDLSFLFIIRQCSLMECHLDL